MTNYPTDLSNSQWEVISKYLDTQRSRKYDLRHIMDAVFYLVKTGCQWRMLPHDFPNWKIVYYYFSTWKKTLKIEHIHEELVEKIRKQEGRNEEPSVGIIDAQSVKNTLVSSESKGFDAGKKVKGIKRHMIVDSLGLILAIVVQSASVQDRDGASEVVQKLVECWKKIVKIFADGSYSGELIEKIKKGFSITVEIVKRTQEHVFKVLPKRWIVERTSPGWKPTGETLSTMNGLMIQG